VKPGEDGCVEYLGVTVEVETKEALKVMVGGKLLWIPKRMIHDNSEVYRMGTSGRLVIPLWLAQTKGLPV
jgi:hypothetical protein